ncbi:helix-turn-helix domain-containing protein [Nostoc parmelioides]|uniref:Helix-turn-helix domain-containing protein n=1 Tax=Nostoc parmelioides FACHB-3921 TaxID=2692909 RepID=A0ABR8BP60_9NOSO|nr:helix-turn-helix domain-containing protein [Nostoc parmelioides]MBD2255646.1 helix-turn-helix domain-containing protein [Nostoc parmelioides FACHB-3921]
MNKQEAAEFLGVSVRALERYVQQGRISVKYEKGKTRPTANFDPAELEAFKAELNQPTIKPSVEARQIATNQQLQTANITYQSGEITRFDEVDEISEFGEIGAIEKLSSIIELLLGKGDNQPIVPIADKLLLTLPESQALTGLSKEVLRGAITSGELKAKVIGKSWRIKRTDLEAYIDQLF